MLKDGSPSNTLTRRTLTGVQLKHKGLVCKLVLSGGGGMNLPSEASVMKRIALREGINEDDIILDQKSLSTVETAVNCRKIVKEHGATKIMIVTDKYHMCRCRFAFQAVGIESEPIYADPDLCRSTNFAMVRSISREAIAWLANAPRIIYLFLRS